jgi:hypothetical protein
VLPCAAAHGNSEHVMLLGERADEIAAVQAVLHLAAIARGRAGMANAQPCSGIQAVPHPAPIAPELQPTAPLPQRLWRPRRGSSVRSGRPNELVRRNW